MWRYIEKHRNKASILVQQDMKPTETREKRKRERKIHLTVAEADKKARGPFGGHQFNQLQSKPVNFNFQTPNRSERAPNIADFIFRYDDNKLNGEKSEITTNEMQNMLQRLNIGGSEKKKSAKKNKKRNYEEFQEGLDEKTDTLSRR